MHGKRMTDIKVHTLKGMKPFYFYIKDENLIEEDKKRTLGSPPEQDYTLRNYLHIVMNIQTLDKNIQHINYHLKLIER